MNILIGPVVQTWRVGFSDARVPTDEEIKSQTATDQCSRKSNWMMNIRRFFILEEGMRIDLVVLPKGILPTW